jgi:glycosyltransferase involved in cell wall biosynthesis
MQLGVEIRKPPFNGPANHVRYVVRELERLGHHVRILLGLDGRIWKTGNLEEFIPVTVPWLDRGPLRLFERAVRRVQSELHLPYAALFESVRFAAACRQELQDFDLFYERASWPGYGGALAARWLNVPLILEHNGDLLADLEAKGIAPQGAQRRLSIALKGYAVKQAAHVVSTGEGHRKQFVERWGVSPNTVTTVENGTTLVGRLKREQLHSFQPHVDSDRIATLVYVGGFDPWHGVSVLLPAFARALAQGAQACLLLIGSGNKLNEARRLVNELNINSAVTFAGHLSPEEYAPMVAKADIGVSPYCGWREFSGLKILDYKAAGIPTIASGQDGQPPTLTHGHTGLIVSPCDEDQLCDAIIRLCADSELRRRMGQAARLEAEQIHGWDHTAAQIEQILTGALSEKADS